ncbi:hypothetical protein ACPV4B_16575 [Vibrio parahaemolyticus]
MSESVNRNYAIAAVVIIVVLFVVFLYGTGNSGALKLKVGDSELEMKVEDNTLSIKEMLELLLKDEDTKRESAALLKEFGNFYKPTDPALIQEIAQQNIKSEVSQQLRSLLYDLKGPFVRSAHTFYDVEKVQIVNAIETLGFDHPVSLKLRELLRYRKGPFEEHAKEILVSVPSGNRIPSGRAASCKGNEFYRREVKIFNHQRTHSISVYVSGSFPCPNKDPDSEINHLIQLSFNDMKNLIGDSPIRKKETAFAEISIDIE